MPAPVRAEGKDALKSVAAEAATPKVVDRPKLQLKVDVESRQREVKDAVHNLNERMRDGGRGLNFVIDKVIGGAVVTVRNQDTGEVVRQIPNQTAVNMAHSIEELKGYLLNAKT